MTNSILSLFFLVNVANLLASPVLNGDGIQNLKFFHRRSIHDNKVELQWEGASLLGCSDFFSTICNNRDFAVINHYDLKKNLNEQIELFMKPLDYLLNDNGKGRKGVRSLIIEQQLYNSCMNLGETDATQNTESMNGNDKEFNENQNNENVDNNEDDKQHVDHAEYDNIIDTSMERDVKKLTEEMRQTIFGPNKNLDTNDDDDYEEILGELAYIEPEVNVKTATQIIKDMFNDIFSVFDKNIRKRFNGNETWQEFDQHLEQYGFGHTFFNIRVATNPTNPKQNIIVLEPPAINDWNSNKLADIMISIFMDIQKEIYDSCNFGTREEFEEKQQDSEAAFIESNESAKNAKENGNDTKERSAVCNSFEDLSETELEVSLVLERNKDVIMFYNNLLKLVFDPVDVTVRESSYTLSSLTRLNSILGYTNSTKAIKKIDWSQIVVEKFKRLNISLADDEIILIRNRPYFKKLKNIFSYSDDETIVHNIRAKFVAENIRYHDWKKAYSLNPIEKSDFCTKQTKLYGISNILLYLFQEEYMKSDSFKAERILHNLIDIFHHNISNTENIPIIQKVQFKSELKAITRHIFGDLNKILISNIYGDFHLTGNYFIDIINYNNMLKNKNLQTLRLESLAYENVPFSINEIENPRNRFILHAMLDFAAARKVIPQSSSEKEIYYATYGVNLASFLYSLLREEKFGFVDMTDRSGIELLLPQTTYSPETVKCFVPENIIDYGYKLAYSTITDIYGLRFAHAALLKDPESNSESSEKFIKAYTETQCNARSKRKVKKVLSQIQELPTLFCCKANENKICDKPAFRL